MKNGDLDYLKEIDPTEYIYQIFYIWKQKEYLTSELYDLTEQEKIKQNTRRFAKRQLTWFKKDKEVNWFEPQEYDKLKSFIGL